MRLRRSTLPSRRRGPNGAARPARAGLFRASFLLHVLTPDLGVVETRVLILNADPVFEDRALAILDENPALEIQIVRSLSETVSALLGENFDGCCVVPCAAGGKICMRGISVDALAAARKSDSRLAVRGTDSTTAVPLSTPLSFAKAVAAA